MVTDELKPLLAAKLLAMADDELILAHRNSEWIGHGPILEEDIALANIAQDELGHASVWFKLNQALTGQDPDQMTFFRDAADFRNTRFVELPRGDWAVTMMRQYLFDAFEMVNLTYLQRSSYEPLADAVMKIRNEELYHYRHSSTWIKRLAQGTDESHDRTQAALDHLWPYVYQLFQPLPDEAALVEAEIVSDLDDICLNWEEVVHAFLTSVGLTFKREPAVLDGREHHTPYLVSLLADLQKVAREDPEAKW